MSLAGHGPKSGSRHVCLIITETRQQGPVLYKGDNGAARPPEGGPAEARELYGLKSAFVGQCPLVAKPTTN